jgi:hypothetical protein
MTQAWQHEIYQPHWYYTLEEWANNLCIIPLHCRRSMAWWCCCCRSPSHNESWPEKVDSPVESPKCVDALWTQEYFREDDQWAMPWLTLMVWAWSSWSTTWSFRENWSIWGFGRFSLRGRRAPTTEIGPTSTQATFGRGKTRIMANLGASGGEDGWEEEDKFEIEAELH